MNTSRTPLQPFVDELASEIFGKTDVRSAYDKFGQLRYVIATLPRREFSRLYPAHALASVFIDGRWLLFQRIRGQITIVEKKTNIHLRVELKRLPLGRISVSLLHDETVLCQAQWCGPSVKSGALSNAEARQRLAVMAGRALAKIGPTGAHWGKEVPSVHVVPESRQKTGFNRDAVLLH